VWLPAGTLALVYGAFSGTRGFLFSVLNQRMVRRLRDGVYAAVIQQDMGWLDRQVPCGLLGPSTGLPGPLYLCTQVQAPIPYQCL
jgi:ABC-type multidrug transport system fused ATPase/permease subunit